VDGERLGEVIVGPQVEGIDFVPLLPTYREDDDRNARALANPPNELEAIYVRKPQIEQDQIRSEPDHTFHRGLPRLGDPYLKAVAAEVGVDGPSDGGLVVGHEDARPTGLCDHAAGLTGV